MKFILNRAIHCREQTMNTLRGLIMSWVAMAMSCLADQPNVVLIMTDDQGYGDMGCHGNPFLKTPYLDQLHAESVRFTDFHVSPYCTPTRASLLTGHYDGYTGAWRTSSGRAMMHRDEKTVANFFADAGYATGMIGKWHSGGQCSPPPAGPGVSGCGLAPLRRCGASLGLLGQRLL